MSQTKNIGSGFYVRPSTAFGFSLIEVMIALAIVAILASIALPSYKNHIMRSNRSAAQTEMMTIANLEQQYFLSNRVYSSTFSDIGYSLPADVAKYYTAAVTVSGALSGNPLSCQDSGSGVPSYCITFTATGNQADDGNLTLDSFGVKARKGEASKWSSP